MVYLFFVTLSFNLQDADTLNHEMLLQQALLYTSTLEQMQEAWMRYASLHKGRRKNTAIELSKKLGRLQINMYQFLCMLRENACYHGVCISDGWIREQLDNSPEQLFGLQRVQFDVTASMHFWIHSNSVLRCLETSFLQFVQQFLEMSHRQNELW